MRFAGRVMSDCACPSHACRGSLSSYMKVVPSIASVRFCYENMIQLMGVGGIRRYRTQETG